MFKRIVLCAVAALAVGNIASAAPSCKETIAGHQIEVPVLEASANYQMASILSDGKVVPVLGKGCYAFQKPGINHGLRYVLCTFQIANNQRLEVYTYAQQVTGLITPAQYILWTGVHAERGPFSNCNNQ